MPLLEDGGEGWECGSQLLSSGGIRGGGKLTAACAIEDWLGKHSKSSGLQTRVPPWYPPKSTRRMCPSGWRPFLLRPDSMRNWVSRAIPTGGSLYFQCPASWSLLPPYPYRASKSGPSFRSSLFCTLPSPVLGTQWALNKHTCWGETERWQRCSHWPRLPMLRHLLTCC